MIFFLAFILPQEDAEYRTNFVLYIKTLVQLLNSSCNHNMLLNSSCNHKTLQLWGFTAKSQLMNIEYHKNQY